MLNGPHTCDGACEGGLWCRDSAPCTHVTVALPPMPSSLDITRVLIDMLCNCDIFEWWCRNIIVMMIFLADYISALLYIFMHHPPQWLSTRHILSKYWLEWLNNVMSVKCMKWCLSLLLRPARHRPHAVHCGRAHVSNMPPPLPPSSCMYVCMCMYMCVCSLAIRPSCARVWVVTRPSPSP